MVTVVHEALHRFFRDHPGTIEKTFRAVGFDKFPDTAGVRLLTHHLTEFGPRERRVGKVLRVDSTDGNTFLLAFATQRGPDRARRRGWPYDITYLHDLYNCPVVLVVICQDAATARWARQPLYVETGFWTSAAAYPLVLGPQNVPVLDEVDPADVLLAALAVVTHARDADEEVLRKLASALQHTDATARADLSAYVQLGLGTLPVAKKWRSIAADTP